MRAVYRPVTGGRDANMANARPEKYNRGPAFILLDICRGELLFGESHRLSRRLPLTDAVKPAITDTCFISRGT